MMDFDTIIRSVNAAVDAEINENGALPIGEIIATLRACAPAAEVRFEPSGQPFGTVQSYRGFYRLPAADAGDKPAKVEDVLIALEEAIDGREHYGYKGGEYVFNRAHPLFHANYGDTSGMAVTRITSDDEAVLLHCSQVYE